MTASRQDIRTDFLSRRPFTIDDFQIEAMDAIDNGDSVLVAAPTGSGKTLVAEYAVAVALAEGDKVFYTTPLKALSNQKFQDLIRVHGAENVGLLTGDNVINGGAPCVVMTTEVLRNMIYAQSDALERLRFVVLDEVHYLQNAYRGPVWEEVIIHAPRDVTLVCLSATVSNAEELTDWIQTVRGSTVPIIEEKRPITLDQHYVVATRGKRELTMIDTFGANGRPNSKGGEYDQKKDRNKPWLKNAKLPFTTPQRSAVVEHLDMMDMLPAIYFVFSRNGCDEAVRQCLNDDVVLTSPQERDRIRIIAESKVESLSEDDLTVLGYESWLKALESGVAAHHAGMVPPFKEAVEACFAEALVKVVFATETLALGINMPARTVVIEKLSKFTGERHEFLTPGEYTQLTGRAGRRGIDEVGHAVVLWSPFVEFDQVASLAGTRTYTLTSSFRPTYNMAANLVSRYPADVAHQLLNLSFAQYRADSDVVRLETSLQKADAKIAAAERRVHCDLGDVREWVARSELGITNEKRDTPELISKAVANLRVGDVIRDPGAQGERHVVIVSTGQRRGHDIRLGILTRDSRRFTLTAKDFALAPKRVGHLDLPKPYNPGNRDFTRRAATSLRNSTKQDDAYVPKGAVDRSAGVAACEDFDEHVKALQEVEKLLRDRERLEKRVMSRAESLARQFDRVVTLLRNLGYVDHWALTETGERLTTVYHESDLLITECLQRGIFDDLTPPVMASLASAFVYETRGPAGTGPTPYFHTKEERQGWGAIESVWKQLTDAELDAGLPMTKSPDPGFCAFAYAWVAGQELSDVLAEEDFSGGDFVRNIKQLIDLLRQLGEAAPRPETAKVARRAADELFRGIVAASSVPTSHATSQKVAPEIPEVSTPTA